MTQRPDEATAKDTGGGFEPHSDGQFPMVCVDVVNLGTNVEQFPGSDPREVDKVALVFASGEERDGQGLTLVTVEMTNSMNEKANLRKFLESWRGKSYSAEQAEVGVPLHKLHKQMGLLSIEQITTKRGRKFAKVRSISPLPKKMDGPEPTVLETYTRPKFLDEKKKLYADALAKHRSETRRPNDDGIPLPDDPGEDDDLPF